LRGNAIGGRLVSVVFGLIVVTLALADARQAELQRFEAVEPHMGTLVRITVYATDEQSASDAFRAAFTRIRDLDRILSDYKPDSELNTITRTAIARAVPISADLFTVLQKSQELAGATGGAFDITQGPVIRLWREAQKTGRLPDPAALKEAAGRSGHRKLHLDPARHTVRLDEAGMALDVGAIGKGYAASEAVEVLEGLGIRSALVAISGDLAFSDAPPGQRGWRIAMYSEDRDPPALSLSKGVRRVLELANAAVSTSGNSEQHADIGGRRYSHIIDPSSRTGLVEDLTVTVVARHGLDADGLDTAVSVLGAERGLRLIDAHPDAAALIIERTTERVEVHLSRRFRELRDRQRGQATGTGNGDRQRGQAAGTGSGDRQRGQAVNGESGSLGPASKVLRTPR
jgi:FAD:protein FMN transferase